MAKVIDKDFGFNRIVQELRRLDHSYVKVGIQEGKITIPEARGDHEKKGGQSMASIGYYNEYGTNSIPARPFMRTSFAEGLNEINSLINQQYSLVLRGKQTARLALQTVGVYYEELVKRKIRSITTPPNAMSTIKAKGSNKPLIDFGQMIQSITSVVTMSKS